MKTADLDPEQRRRRRIALLAVAWASLLVFVAMGVSVGAADVQLSDVWSAIGNRLGNATSPDTLSESIVWSIRLPRVLTAIVVGASLAVAGCGLQGSFRNDMADPQLMGISAAAGLGAVAGIAATPVGGGPWLMMAAAAAAGTVAALLIRTMAGRAGEGARFVLAGLAVGLAALAWLGAVVIAWDSPRVPTFTFWVFGGLSASTWSSLTAGASLAGAGIAAVVASGRSLDVLALGAEAARHSGHDPRRIGTVALAGVGVATGAAVGLGGVIGLIGLVVPLLVRRHVGPSHRWLMTLSAITAAAVMVALDTAARTIAAPVEIPVGLLTAGVGGPIFAWAVFRTRWAP